MIITLREDISSLGKKNERVKVSDAYARNVLIPQKKAFVGEQTLFQITPKKTKDAVLTESEHKQLADPFTFEASANEKGGLYKKIGEAEIKDKVSQRIHFPRERIYVDKTFEPIRKIGTFDVILIIGGKSYTIKLIVTKE